MLRLSHFLSVMSLGAFVLPCANAGTPRVNHLYPSGGQRGTEVEVVFSGSNLADARGVLFNTSGFSATAVKNEGGKFTAKIKLPADVALGEHICRVITASGVA